MAVVLRLWMYLVFHGAGLAQPRWLTRTQDYALGPHSMRYLKTEAQIGSSRELPFVVVAWF
jgi:hypothetical protein